MLNKNLKKIYSGFRGKYRFIKNNLKLKLTLYSIFKIYLNPFHYFTNYFIKKNQIKENYNNIFIISDRSCSLLLAITQLYLQDIQNNNSCKTIFKNLFVQDNPSKFLIEIFNKLNLNLIETDQFINYLKIKNLKCENVWIHGFAPMKYFCTSF